jgi:ubiquinone/menaquinone biosynthesis C-methylase UbiE
MVDFDSLYHQYVEFREKTTTTNDIIEKPAIESILSEISFRHALDIGCGLGTYTTSLAKYAEHVTACDKSRLMIEHAKAACAHMTTNVEFVVRDFRELTPGHNNRYDFILVSLAIMTDLDEMLKVAASLLSPRGYILYTHFHPIYGAGKDDISDGGIYVRDYWGNRDRISRNTFGKGEGADYQFSWQYYTIEEHVRLMAKNGFRVEKLIEPKPVSLNKHSRLFRLASLFPFIIVLLGRKDEDRLSK